MMEAIIALAGVGIGFLLNILWDSKKARDREQRDAHDAAMQITVILEGYVHDCVAVAIDIGETNPADDFGTTYGVERPTVKLPEPPAYPADINWKSLDDLSWPILELKNTVKTKNIKIANIEERGVALNARKGLATRQRSYAEIGLEVCSLIKRLREKYNLEPMEYAELYMGHPPEKIFEDTVKHTEWLTVK